MVQPDAAALPRAAEDAGRGQAAVTDHHHLAGHDAGDVGVDADVI